MLDIQYIRENKDLVKKAAKDKNRDEGAVDRVIHLDEKRRELLQRIEGLRAERNKLGKEDRDKGRKIKEELKQLEPELKKVEAEFKKQMLEIVNVPAKDVPAGKEDTANKLVRTWGEKPDFSTKGGQGFKAKDHVELGESLGILDLKRGVKVGGFRGYFLKKEAVLLQFGIMQYALNKLIEKGFDPMIPPIIVKKQALINTGHFPWGEADVYKTFDDENEEDERFLAGTAEVPLVSFYEGEILNEKDLPKLMAGFSPCYRREIGSYGRDTKGVYRVHEFMKIEQVVLCKDNEKEAQGWHEKLTKYSEEMLQDLNLPYRIMLMCTGDMGEPQVKKYDIETWMPGRNAYGETMSSSLIGEFQARRAKIKYKTKKGEVKYVTMLNNTALASPRILVAILENYQQKDGSVKVPEVLQKYVGKKIISADKK